jgi:hypothetical protein
MHSDADRKLDTAQVIILFLKKTHMYEPSSSSTFTTLHAAYYSALLNAKQNCTTMYYITGLGERWTDRLS